MQLVGLKLYSFFNHSTTIYQKRHFKMCFITIYFIHEYHTFSITNDKACIESVWLSKLWHGTKSRTDHWLHIVPVPRNIWSIQVLETSLHLDPVYFGYPLVPKKVKFIRCSCKKRHLRNWSCSVRCCRSCCSSRGLRQPER